MPNYDDLFTGQPAPQDAPSTAAKNSSISCSGSGAVRSGMGKSPSCSGGGESMTKRQKPAQHKAPPKKKSKKQKER